MLKETNCDAVMIGRATMGNPWFIKQCVEYLENNNLIEEPTYNERVDMILKHYNLLKENYSEKKALLDIKTHALAYLKYIPGTKELKNKFATSRTEEEFVNCINETYEDIKTIK